MEPEPTERPESDAASECGGSVDQCAPTPDCTDPACCGPLHEITDLLGRKYVLELACVLDCHDRLRFSEIEAHFPSASTSTLSTRLSDLVDAGLVSREQYDEIPPRVEYGLTDEGRELGERLEPLVAWAEERG